MQAESRTRTVHHHEQTLPLGAHYTEVDKAINLAVANHGRDKRAISDVTVTADDTHLIIGHQSLNRVVVDDLDAEADVEVSR